MRTAKLVNKLNGCEVNVHSTTEHPDSSYGIPVWVDDDGVAYIEDNPSYDNPFYQVKDIKDLLDEE